MKGRNPARIIDITDEVVANPPESPTNTTVWYDRTLEDFGIVHYKNIGAHRGAPSNPDRQVVRLIYILSHARARGAILAGRRVISNRMLYLDAKTVQEARDEIAGLATVLPQWEESGKEMEHVRPGDLKKVSRGGGRITPESIEKFLTDSEPVDNPNYDALMSALMDAYSQAATGKGALRHAAGLNFEKQDMMKIMNEVGPSFAEGQALKKILEGRRMTQGKYRHELLGAIVYLAGIVVWLDRQAKDPESD